MTAIPRARRMDCSSGFRLGLLGPINWERFAQSPIARYIYLISSFF